MGEGEETKFDALKYTGIVAETMVRYKHSSGMDATLDEETIRDIRQFFGTAGLFDDKAADDKATTRQSIINQVRQNGMKFIERSDWHAKEAKAAGLEDDWNYTKIAIHQAGRSYSCNVNASGQMHIIQNEHQKPSGNPDIGYHYAISCTGEIYEARDIRYKGQHLYHYNTGVIGIVILEDMSDPEETLKLDRKLKEYPADIANFASKGFRMEQTIIFSDGLKDSLRTLIDSLTKAFHITELGGHREFPHQKDGDGHLCPGNHGIELVNELRSWSGLARPSL